MDAWRSEGGVEEEEGSFFSGQESILLGLLANLTFLLENFLQGGQKIPRSPSSHCLQHAQQQCNTTYIRPPQSFSAS